MSTDPINPEGSKDPSQPMGRIEQTPEKNPAADTDGAFSRAMANKKPGAPSSTNGPNKTNETSPLDLAKTSAQAPTKANAQTLNASFDQANTLTKQIESQVKSAKPGSLKSDQQELVSKKLAAANENLKKVSSKLGFDTNSLPSTPEGKGPIAQWLSLLSNGQRMMQESKSRLPTMLKNGEVNPGMFLSLQMQMSSAMVSLDFASQILGKGGDALNKLMNVNI
jgi:hypothetical protein